MIYFWRLLEGVYPGPAPIVFLQNAVFLLGLVTLVALYFRNRICATTVAASIVIFTPLLGPMLVAWKDVGMAAFLIAGFSALAHADRKSSWSSLALGLSALTIATAYRHDAAVATAPLFVYLTWIMLRRRRPRPSHTRLLLLSLPLLTFICIGKFTLDFAVAGLPVNWTATALFDLIGISHYAGVNVLPRQAYEHHAEFDQRDLDAIYFVDHVNLSLYAPAEDDGLKRLLDVNSDSLKAAWVHAVTHYPASYVRHRAHFMANFIALGRENVFYPLHYGVDENDLGVSFTPTKLTGIVTGWVLNSRLIAKPWACYLAGLVAIGLLVSNRVAGRRVPLMLFGSGYAHLAVAGIIMPASDLRYQLWSLTAVATGLAIAIRLLATSGPGAIEG